MTDKQIAEIKYGQRISFSGELALVDRSESVKNPKYTLLADEPAPPTPTTGELKDLSITMVRTMCYGTCPEYTLTITPDGQVTFNGNHYTTVKGAATTTIESKKMVEIAIEIKKARFFDLLDNYEAQVTDGPTYYLTVQMDGKKKTVKDYVAAPQRFDLLLNRIDQIVNSAQWIGDGK